MRVLVTGADGFTGRAIVRELLQAGFAVTAATRVGTTVGGADSAPVGDITVTDWGPHLEGVHAIVHLAARVHAMREQQGDEVERLYHQVNCDATRRLAVAASQTGVRRFIFMSTIKVNGEGTGEQPITESSDPSPQDAYARSKLAAENALATVLGAASSEIQYTVLRPPLIFGPGVGANFLRLLRWVDREIPLPLPAGQNRRSLLSIWSLAEVVRLCLSTNELPRLLLVSDAPPISTKQLLQTLARGLERRLRLLPVPALLLSAAATMVGRRAEISRLFGSLEIDPSRARESLGWRPGTTLEDALVRTARWYRKESSDAL